MITLKETVNKLTKLYSDLNNCNDGFTCSMIINDIELAVKSYTTESIKASLEKASKKVTMFKICDVCNIEFPVLNNIASMQTCPSCGKSNHIWTKINKQSIVNPENIVLL